MEELFLKMTDDVLASSDDFRDPGPIPLTANGDGEHNLLNYHLISVGKQWFLLFCKRLRILCRSWAPYIVAMVLSIVGASVAPMLIQGFYKRVPCPKLQDLVNNETFR